MEENSNFFQQIFGENYTPNVGEDIQEIWENIENSNPLSKGEQQQQEDNESCPTKEKENIVAYPLERRRDFKQLVDANASVSSQRKKSKICLTLDNENYDFYNGIAEKSNIKLQRVLNLALLCFQEYLKDLSL